MEQDHRKTENLETVRKRVDYVRLKLVRESSFLYAPKHISSPSDAIDLARKYLEDAAQEEFLVISLGNKNVPLSVSIVSRGAIDHCYVACREVYKVAIHSNARSIIVAHNHPSGETQPSKQDDALTTRLMQAGELLGIPCFDHLIIGSDGNYFSFKEKLTRESNE